ncbi:hypothetical protein RvY_02770-2 [Ramazzottius varieornatus]|nr:hypothetical protein RvY_02770-2 [Ramazzottius varieornatus]
MIFGFVIQNTCAVVFDKANYYLNATCIMNAPIATIVATSADPNLTYQIFGSQDFIAHKLRGDIIMTRKPKDPYPLFYLSAMETSGVSATAVVEVSHTCPTVSFDAVSYHFFALRRAPSSIIGTLQASGGDDIRYSIDSDSFAVDDVSGTITAKVVLPVDTTSIIYVKASDKKGNTDVAEVVVEVIGCYMDVDVQHERQYNVVFQKRCYNFATADCESGTLIGNVLAKGYPDPTYELQNSVFYVNPDDGVLILKKDAEPGLLHPLNVMATNGPGPDNRDVTFVTVDTRQCRPLTTKLLGIQSSTPTSGLEIASQIPTDTTTEIFLSASKNISWPETTVQVQTTRQFPMFENDPPIVPDLFADVLNDTLSEDDPTAFNDTSLAFQEPLQNGTGTDVDLANVADVWTMPPSQPEVAYKPRWSTVQMRHNSSFVVHFTSVNISKTVKPVYVQNGHSDKIFVKGPRFKAEIVDNRGIEIV